MVKICSKCGEKNPDSAFWCSNCNAKLMEKSQINQQNINRTNFTTQDNEPYDQLTNLGFYPNDGGFNIKSKQQKNSYPTIAGILMSIIGFLAIIELILLLILFSNLKSPVIYIEFVIFAFILRIAAIICLFVSAHQSITRNRFEYAIIGPLLLIIFFFINSGGSIIEIITNLVLVIIGIISLAFIVQSRGQFKKQNII